MDRAHRQDLKHDRFVEQVGHTVEYAAEHKNAVIKWTGIGVAVLAVVLGFYFYNRSQAETRQADLREAIRVQDATVGPAPSAYVLSFPTEDAKRAAVQEAWSELASKYDGKQEGILAHYYLGVNAADQGNVAEAEKQLKIVADSGKEPLASQAKLSLAQLYAGQNRTADAEKLLRPLIDKPTVLVSKGQASIALARILAKEKPAEARKLLEPLRTEPGALSRTALNLLAEIPNQ